MNVEFKNLELENFKSHQELNVEFGHTTSITGDNAKGKSSIGEAITFLLYGTDLLGSKLNPTPETYESDATVVHLFLSVDGKELKLGREIIGGRNKYILNDVPSKATEFNQTVEQLFDRELFLSLFNPSYFFTMHWQKQREMLLDYVTAPANKEVFAELPKPQAEKLSELVKKHSLEDLEKIHRDNRRKLDKELIIASSRTKTLQEQVDKFEYVAPRSSLRAEKAQTEKTLKEKEGLIKKDIDNNQKINVIHSEIDSLTMQIDRGREKHSELKQREIDMNCHACGQELTEEGKKTLILNKENELSSIAEQVNPLIKERKELREELESLELIQIDEELENEIKRMQERIFELERDLHKHDQLEQLDKEVAESKEKESEVKKLLNESIFIIDAIKDFHAKEAELQANKVQGLFDNLSIRLFDEVKSTGELKPTFVVQMDGKDYVKLSTAEKIKAGLELRDVLSDQSDLFAPCFVDNAESITKFKEPNGQLIMAKVVAGKELEVVFDDK